MIGRAFGTFGELLQGALPDGEVDFLVTFPVARWSVARFRPGPDGRLRVFPPDRTKSLRLAERLLDASGRRAGGTLTLSGDLPVGKGMASSSADLVATARAVGSALGMDTGPSAIEGWLRPIEPTDGVMHDGVVAFEHRRVRLRGVLGGLPALTVLAVDEGGRLDTVAFNRRPKPYSAADRLEYADLLETIAGAIATGDLAAVGAVATRSAVLNQRLHHKRNLDGLIRIAADTGALGVACAHSGTVAGLLFPQDPDAAAFAAAMAACTALPGTTSVVRSLAFDSVGCAACVSTRP